MLYSNWTPPTHQHWKLVLSLLGIIKIISYVDIAFFYKKATCKYSRRFHGNKGLCHCSRSLWFRWKLALPHVAFEQLWWKYLLCLNVEFLWLFSIWTHSCSTVHISFFNNNLQPVMLSLMRDFIAVCSKPHHWQTADVSAVCIQGTRHLANIVWVGVGKLGEAGRT